MSTPTETPWPGRAAPDAADAAGAGVRLTARERLVLQWVARDYTPDQIAALYGVAVVEVLWNLQRALGELGALTVREAVDAAIQRGLLV